MASYPILAANLTALNATKNDPTGAESADKLDDALVQTRNFIYDFLSVPFNADGTLKTGAFSSMPAGTIQGSNPVGSVERQIDQRSIQAIDIALAVITSAELADNAVTTAKIAADAVTAAKLADSAVETANITAAAVTTAKIADSAVTAPKILDATVVAAKLAVDSVTGPKIVNRVVDGTKLPACPVGFILVGGATVNGIPDCVTPQRMGGAFSIAADGTVSLAADIGDTTGFAIISEVAANGVAGGKSSANTWNPRGSGVNDCPAWTKITDGADMININGTKIEFKVNGVYRVFVSAPAQNINGHMVRVTVKKDAIATDTAIKYGSSEYAPNGHVTRSFVDVVLAFSGATETLFPYITVDHWTDGANGGSAGALGKAVGATGATEQYAIVEVFKLI